MRTRRARSACRRGAALATGRWVLQIRAWDNAAPYHGEPPSWHHRLRDSGHQVVSIGKLHFRATADDNGFSAEMLPLHVLDGKGDLIGMLREPPAERGSMPALAESAGPGDSTYNDYDRAITAAACEWIGQANRRADKPWVLFVSSAALRRRRRPNSTVLPGSGGDAAAHGETAPAPPGEALRP